MDTSKIIMFPQGKGVADVCIKYWRWQYFS